MSFAFGLSRLCTDRTARRLALLGLMVASFTSACSQREMRTLQNDYKNHNQAYSSYVKENLKGEAKQNVKQNDKPNSQTKQKASYQATKINQQMKAVQAKLLASKGRASGHINNARLQNGLFTPSPALQQRVKGLRNQTQQENWLKTHSSLQSVLSLVLRNNLTIQARLQEAKATLSQYDQVSFLDDTMAQYASFAGKPASANFPFPGLLSLKGSIIDSTVESSRLNVIKSIQDVLTEARVAYYELQFAQQENRLVKKKSDLLRALKDQMGDSFESQNTDLDVIVKVDVDIEKQRNRRQLAKHRLLVQQARLNALMNLSPSFKLGQLDSDAGLMTQPESARLLLAAAKKHRVEITLLQTELKKIERIIQLSERRFYPDYSANYSRFQNRTIKQVGSDATQASFSNRPPSPLGTKRTFFGNKNAYLEETKDKYKALQAKLNALYKLTEDDVQRTFLQYQAQERSYSLYVSRVIPKLKTALNIIKNQYETGGSTYLHVINTQNMIIDARLSSLQAIKEKNIKVAQLSRFVGRPYK